METLGRLKKLKISIINFSNKYIKKKMKRKNKKDEIKIITL